MNYRVAKINLILLLIRKKAGAYMCLYILYIVHIYIYIYIDDLSPIRNFKRADIISFEDI